MSDEPEIQTVDTSARAAADAAASAARASLDLSAVAAAADAGDTGESPEPSEPDTDGQQAASSETEPQPATPAGGDLQTTTPGQTAAQPAPAAPPAPQTPPAAPEVRAPIEEVKITEDGIRQTLSQLMDERQDVSARVQELDALGAAINRDHQKSVEIEKQVADYNKIISESTAIYNFLKVKQQKSPEDLGLQEELREAIGNLNEARGSLALAKTDLAELRWSISQKTPAYKAGVQQVRDFTVQFMRQGVEKQRAEQQQTELVAQETRSWEGAFQTVYKESGLPAELAPEVNRYLASFAHANVSMFDKKTYDQFMRERLPDIQKIFGHGRQTGASSYADAKRKDAAQPTPKLKANPASTKTEGEPPNIEEIRNNARERFVKALNGA